MRYAIRRFLNDIRKGLRPLFGEVQSDALFQVEIETAIFRFEAIAFDRVIELYGPIVSELYISCVVEFAFF